MMKVPPRSLPLTSTPDNSRFCCSWAGRGAKFVLGQGLVGLGLVLVLAHIQVGADGGNLGSGRLGPLAQIFLVSHF